MHPFVTTTLDTPEIRTAVAPPLSPTSSPSPSAPPGRMTRLRVRHVEPRSVAKATIMFHGVVVLIGLVAIGVLYAVAAITGALDGIERSVRVVVPGFRLKATSLLSGSMVLGLFEIAFATAVNAAAVRIYNLVADGGGAIEVTLEAD